MSSIRERWFDLTLLPKMDGEGTVNGHRSDFAVISDVMLIL